MKNHNENTFGRTRQYKRLRSNRLRNLRLENLEGRRLMAADLAGPTYLPNHNYLIAADVNEDFRVSGLDALLVINKLNDKNASEGEVGNSQLWDVSGDGRLSPTDALLIINELNAEGERDANDLLEFSFNITDPDTGAALTRVPVGSEFMVNVSVQDIRANPLGVFSGALDIGLSTLNLASFLPGYPGGVASTSFRSGILFDSFYDSNRFAVEGGGIQISFDANEVARVQDGQTFSISSSAGTQVFEFDTNSAIGASRIAVSIPVGASFSQIGNAMVTAINGSTLGVTSRYNGDQIVLLPQGSGVSFDPLTSQLSASSIANEYLNEIRALANSLSGGATPGAARKFVSLRFRAEAPGNLTFTPNQAESLDSENLLFGSSTALLPDFVNYGDPFTLEIFSDATTPVAGTVGSAGDSPVTTNEDTAADFSTTALKNLILPSVTFGAGRTGDVVSALEPIAGVTRGSIRIQDTTPADGLADQGFVGVYTPAQDFVGIDSFRYRVRDNTGLENVGTVFIKVLPVNDAPIAVADAVSVIGDSGSAELSVLTNDKRGPDTAIDEASQTLSIVALGATDNGGTVAISGGGQTVTYTPAAGFLGTETFSYTIRDNGTPALESTATVTVTVEAGTLPRARGDQASVAEGSQNNRISVLGNDLTNTGQVALLIGIGSQPTNGTVTIDNNGTPADASDDVLLYTPTNADFFGTDLFTYTMNETTGTGPDSTGTVTVTVTNVNDNPVLFNDTVQSAENETRTIPFADLLANDNAGPGENAQTLTITTVSAITAGAGSVAISGTNVVYTPTAGFSGTFLFTYNATDNGSPALSALNAATVTINVEEFNDPPTVGNDTLGDVGLEDRATTIAISTLLSNDSPVESNQTLQLNTVTALTEGGGSVAISGSNVIYTPAGNFNGAFQFSYNVLDNGFPAKSAITPATVSLNVLAVNDAPEANTDTVRGFKNIALRLPIVDLLANDTTGPANESAQTKSLTAVSGGTNGTAVLDLAAGVVIFTPTAEFTGAASFRYTLQDNGGTANGGVDSAQGTVNINIEEFLPSSIGGTVWVNETEFVDSDSRIDAAERRLGGVEVTLVGTSLGRNIQQTALTLADGTYEFEELGPGTYTITFGSIPGMIASTMFRSNSYTFTITEPGGSEINQNFAVVGLSGGEAYRLSRMMDQLVSRFNTVDPSIGLRGAYFSIGSDNSMNWGLKLDGFENALYTEAVLDGSHLLLTIVDGDHRVHTARISDRYFAYVQDASGNRLVRLIGSASNFTFQQVNMASPPFTAANYLSTVEAVFEHYDW